MFISGCSATPQDVGPFFRRNFISRGICIGQNKPWLPDYTRSQPRLGLVGGSRGPTQIHIRGLCHWAGEPAGHLVAESPSRRTAGPASARKTSPPCPHSPHGSFRARCANAMSQCLRALSFASSRRSLTHVLGHSQWPKPPMFVHATAPARSRLKSNRPRAIRPLDRYKGARAIRASPSDVGACHRVVRRHTCCSPVTRRSM